MSELLRLEPPGELPFSVALVDVSTRETEPRLIPAIRLSYPVTMQGHCPEADFPIEPPHNPGFERCSSADELAKLLEIAVYAFGREGWESSRLHLTEEHRNLPDLFVDPETGEVPFNVFQIDASQLFRGDSPSIGWVQPYDQTELLDLRLIRQRMDRHDFLIQLDGEYFNFHPPILTILEIKQVAEAIRSI